MKPKVSVIFLTYRERPQWLLAAIDSVLRQDDVSVQLIVTTVKDDPAVEVALRKGLEVLVNDRPGIYYQLNNALPLVAGDWFTIAGGNDVLLPTKFIDEVRLCQERSRKVCYSDWYTADALLENRKCSPCREYSYDLHMTIGNIVPDNAMTTRSIIDEYGPFRSDLFDDIALYDFWLLVAEGEGEDVFIHNRKPEWIYRCSSDSRHTRRKRDRVARQRYQARLSQLQAYHRAHPGGKK